MYFAALASILLFASSLTLTFADAAAGAEISRPAGRASQTLSYGPDKAQTLDFWHAEQASGPAPLVLFVHGGGWTRGSKDNATGPDKAPHYTAEGYNFASINYRLVPDATVEQEAQDVATALATLIKQADALGIDRRRIVLMGHSAGATGRTGRHRSALPESRGPQRKRHCRDHPDRRRGL